MEKPNILISNSIFWWELQKNGEVMLMLINYKIKD